MQQAVTDNPNSGGVPGSARVIKLANVIIPAADQDRMLQFYTEALGLEQRVDVPMGPGARWIEVAASQTETPIAICPPGPGVTAGGKDTGISLQTDDIDAYHAQLKDRGVEVDPEVGRYERRSAFRALLPGRHHLGQHRGRNPDRIEDIMRPALVDEVIAALEDRRVAVD